MLKLAAKLGKILVPAAFEHLQRAGVQGLAAGLEQAPDLTHFGGGIGRQGAAEGNTKQEEGGLTFHAGTMPPSVKGIKDEPILQPEENGSLDRYGVASLTRVELVPVSDFTRLLRALYTVHPQFPTMAVSRVNWDKTRQTAGQFYRVAYIYEGFIGRLPEPTYELSGTLSEEPIETHPNFEDFAGTPSAPLNGAVFLDPETNKPTTSDELGVFTEFGISGNKAGVSSYASPTVMWTEIRYSTSKPSELGDLGEIDNPNGGPPNFTGRDWLLWDISYRRRGAIYEIRISWKLSGRNGWDEDIYG